MFKEPVVLIPITSYNYELAEAVKLETQEIIKKFHLKNQKENNKDLDNYQKNLDSF